jgi:hypothetical protein
MDDEPQEPVTGEARALDEELERLHRSRDDFDPVRHRRRNRMLAAIGVGALAAGLVYVVLAAFDQARNPCQRVRDYFCALDGKSAACQSYQSILQESIEETSPMARGAIRQQCQTRIERLKIDEGIKVR